MHRNHQGGLENAEQPTPSFPSKRPVVGPEVLLAPGAHGPRLEQLQVCARGGAVSLPARPRGPAQCRHPRPDLRQTSAYWMTIKTVISKTILQPAYVYLLWASCTHIRFTTPRVPGTTARLQGLSCHTLSTPTTDTSVTLSPSTIWTAQSSSLLPVETATHLPE